VRSQRRGNQEQAPLKSAWSPRAPTDHDQPHTPFTPTLSLLSWVHCLLHPAPLFAAQATPTHPPTCPAPHPRPQQAAPAPLWPDPPPGGLTRPLAWPAPSPHEAATAPLWPAPWHLVSADDEAHILHAEHHRVLPHQDLGVGLVGAERGVHQAQVARGDLQPHHLAGACGCGCGGVGGRGGGGGRGAEEGGVGGGVGWGGLEGRNRIWRRRQGEGVERGGVLGAEQGWVGGGVAGRNGRWRRAAGVNLEAHSVKTHQASGCWLCHNKHTHRSPARLLSGVHSLNQAVPVSIKRVGQRHTGASTQAHHPGAACWTQHTHSSYMRSTPHHIPLE
jgi:hypothetical protein